MGRRGVIGWLAHLSGACAYLEEREAEIEGLKEQNAELREVTKNLSNGYARVEDLAVRMFQAEDEQRRLRVAITQAAFSARPGSPVVRAMHALLTGHILHPAKRVTDEE